MGRFAAYSQRDRPWQQDGDAGWKGLDLIHDPGTVEPGYLIKSYNKRLREGPASTRPGTTEPADFAAPFENIIIGSGIYSNPNGSEVMLVATLDADYVWVLQFGKDPIQIDLSGGELTGTSPFGIVQFVQAFDKVLLLRFPTDTPLIWDGNVANTFDPVTTPGPHTLIPNTTFGQPFQNRVLLYSPLGSGGATWRDRFIATDVIDPEQYDPDLNTFRVNAGESDLITCIQPYFKGSVIVFMENSVHMVESFTIDPFATSQRMLNSRLGSVSVRMPFMDGNDIIFLSRSGAGFYRISEVIQDEISALPRAISWRIQPMIDRINWDQAAIWACSEGLGDYAFFFAPIDGLNGGSNACFVYNTATREFETIDTWDDPGFKINAAHVTLYDKQQRLFGLDYAEQRIYLMYDGIEDEINGDSVPIKDSMATRGYTVNDPASFKKFLRTNIGLRTYDPVVEISSRTDGFNELKHLASVTKNRFEFYVQGHKRFDPATDDPDEPHREDYAITDTPSAIEDFELLPDGPLAFIPATSLLFTGDKQETLEKFQVRQDGRWCSIEIENTSGQCDILGVSVDAITSQEGIRTLA